MNSENVVVSAAPLLQRKSTTVSNAGAKNVKKQRVQTPVFHENPAEEVTASDMALFVFYDFETTQDTKYSDSAIVHVQNLVSLEQFCSRCDNIQDINIDCEQCGRRKLTFGDDPVGDLLTYLCKSRPWWVKIVAIAHNATAFDLHFLLNRAILLNGIPT